MASVLQGAISMKTCSKCGRELPATPEFFNADNRHGPGLKAACKRCQAAHAARRHAARREEMAAAYAAYRAAHKEEIAKRRRSARRRAGDRAYREAHRSEIRARGHAHYLAHREGYIAGRSRRRARLRNAQGAHTAADVRAQFDRQKGRCYWCGEKVAWRGKHVDHVMPLSKGGSNGPENLVVACASCNLKKGAKHPMEWAGRLL